MRITTATTASIASLLLATATSALPTPQGSDLQTRSCTRLRPRVVSQYSTWTGARQYNTPIGLVSKPNGQSTDITTLVTFQFDNTTAGRQCHVGFDLGAGTSSYIDGAAQFDIFTSLQPADAVSTVWWPNGNLRDQYAGRLQAVKPGDATYVTDITAPAISFPCPSNSVLGGELVGVGDYDSIIWDSATEGPFIEIC